MCRLSKCLVKKSMSADTDLHYAPLRDGVSQQHRRDADHRLDHPTEDQAIHQPTEIDRSKPAQKCRRLSLVPQFYKFHVGKNSRPPPISCEKENGHHPGQTLPP